MIEERDLAQLLDRALQQRQSPPSRTPQVAELVHLARTLESSAGSVAPTPQFRRDARQRLLAHTTTSTPNLKARPRPVRDRLGGWAARLAAGLGAFALVGPAGATASASALPGDPLYPVKQASEAIAIGIAPTDSARQEVLLAQADVRLDETARLLQQGRGSDALDSVGRYDAVIDTVAAGAPNSPALQAHLDANQSRLTQLLETAPTQARPGLQRALAATRRGQANRQSAPYVEVSPTAVAGHRDPPPTPVEPTPPANSSEASAFIEPTVAATEVERVSEPVHDQKAEAPRPTPEASEDTGSKKADSAPSNSHAVSNSEGNPNMQGNPATNSRGPAKGGTQDRAAGRGRP